MWSGKFWDFANLKLMRGKAQPLPQPQLQHVLMDPTAGSRDPTPLTLPALFQNSPMLNPRGHRAMPRRKFPTLYPPALPFGLLRRLGLSKGTGHGAGGQLRLPSHTAQAQAALLLGQVTASPHLDTVVAAELWAGLCWQGMGRAGK